MTRSVIGDGAEPERSFSLPPAHRLAEWFKPHDPEQAPACIFAIVQDRAAVQFVHRDIDMAVGVSHRGHVPAAAWKTA